MWDLRAAVVLLPFGAVEGNREVFPSEMFLGAVSRSALPQGQLLIPPSTCSWPQLAPKCCCRGATNLSCGGLRCCSLGTPGPALLAPFLPWLWFLVLPGAIHSERAGLAGQKELWRDHAWVRRNDGRIFHFLLPQCL